MLRAKAHPRKIALPLSVRSTARESVVLAMAPGAARPSQTRPALAAEVVSNCRGRLGQLFKSPETTDSMSRSHSTLAHEFGSLPTRVFRLFVTHFMRLPRIFFALVLALLFVLGTNRCLIAAAFPGEVEKCCEQERAPGDSSRELPCDGKDCASCATLESGANLAALVPLAMPAPVWTEDEIFAALLRRLVAVVTDEVGAPAPDPAAMPSPPWCDVMSKALPVRGPSLVG